MANGICFALGFVVCLHTRNKQDFSTLMGKLTTTTANEEENVPAATASREYGRNGWHSIEVFYGRNDHFEVQQTREQVDRGEQLPNDWVAQARKDVIVSRLLREMTHGYFIDLAANHAVSISNTYSLERKLQWTGLCMEPNPRYWGGLAHRDCQVVGAVVGGTRMEEVTFQFTDVGYMGGIVGDEFDNHDANGAEVKYTVPLHEILRRFSAPREMEYLSLDVEGAEMLIMQHFPFDEYSFKIMTVERPKDDLKALFTGHGYELVGVISTASGETLWVRTAIKDSLNLASVQEFIVA
jgi:hypothetical protein